MEESEAVVISSDDEDGPLRQCCSPDDGQVEVRHGFPPCSREPVQSRSRVVFCMTTPWVRLPRVLAGGGVAHHPPPREKGQDETRPGLR